MSAWSGSCSVPAPPPAGWHQQIAAVRPAGSYAGGGNDWRTLHIDMTSGIGGMRRGRSASPGMFQASPESPRAAGHASGAGNFLDRRAVHLDMETASGGLHRSGYRTASRSPTTLTKFNEITSMKAMNVPLQSMSMDALPGRRNLPAPRPAPDRRNEMVQISDSMHYSRLVGRLHQRPDAHEEHVPMSAREFRRLHHALSPRGLPAQQGEMTDATKYQEEASHIATPVKGKSSRPVDYGVNLKKLDLPVKGRKSGLGAGSTAFSMCRSLRRLDSCALKLEMVAQALVQEAQRQSLKRVA